MKGDELPATVLVHSQSSLSDSCHAFACKQIVFNYRAWTSIYRHAVIRRCMTVRLGGRAFNADVVGLDGVMRRLLDYQRGSRPLVLVFGSCT